MSPELEANKENRTKSLDKTKASNPETLVDVMYPNPRDPDVNCKVCDITFEDQPLFLKHLQQNHKSQFKIPQMVSRDLICRVCFFKFKNKARYRRHLVKIHNVKTSKIVEREPKAAPHPKYPNTYCDFCEIDTLKHDRYRQHLEGLHDIKYEVPDILNSSIASLYKPDPFDPDFYCLECEINFKTKSLYYKHLFSMHRMCTKMKNICFVHNSRNMDYDEDLPFDIKNPDNVMCDDCNREYKTPYKYKQHLKYQHHMRLIFSSPKMTPYEVWTTLKNYSTPPDPNDISFRCSLCDIQYPTRDNYHDHLIVSHHLQVFGIQKERPPIDFTVLGEFSHINDPDYTCRTCDKKFDTKTLYHQHLNESHGVSIPNFTCCFSGCNNLRDDLEDLNNAACLVCTTKRSNPMPIVYSLAPLLKMDEYYNRGRAEQEAKRKPPQKFHREKVFTWQENNDSESEEYELSLEDNNTEEEAGKSEVKDNGNTRYSDMLLLCTICKIVFDQESAYNKYSDHFLQHCTKKKLDNGDEVEINKEEGKYACSTCSAVYSKWNEFIHHFNLAPHNIWSFNWLSQFPAFFDNITQSDFFSQSSKDRDYSCPVCSLDFPSRLEHRLHLESEHFDEVMKLKYIQLCVNNNILPYLETFYRKCDLCDNAYYSNNSLEEHKKRSHQKDADMSLLVESIKTEESKVDINGDDMKTSDLVCDYCSKCDILFSNFNTYRQHLALHTNYITLSSITHLSDLASFNFRLSYCVSCLERFQDLEIYKLHLVTAHQFELCKSESNFTNKRSLPEKDNALEKYCKTCDFKFINARKYDRHMNNFHVHKFNLSTKNKATQDDEYSRRVAKRKKIRVQ